MMLFNLQMTLVLYANLNVMKLFPKNEKILEQTDKYLTENQLTLNADRTEMLFFTNHTNSDPEFFLMAKLSNQLMNVVIWEYKLIQT